MAIAALILSFLALVSRWMDEGSLAADATGTPAAPSVGSSPESSERELRLLRERVAQLELKIAQLQTTPDRVSIPESEAGLDLEARLAALERQLAALGAESSHDPAGPAALSSREGRLAHLERMTRLRLIGQLGADERKEELRLREQCLREDLRAPEAGALLTDLVGQYVWSGRAQEALGLLNELGGRIDMPAWQLEKTYANAYSNVGRYDEARIALERVMSDPIANAHERASAQFSIAYTFERQGKPEEARRHYEWLLRDLGHSRDPAVQGALSGARIGLERLAGGK